MTGAGRRWVVSDQGIAAGTVTAHLARATRALRAYLTPVTEQEQKL